MGEFFVVATDGVAEAGLAPFYADGRFTVSRFSSADELGFGAALADAHGLMVRSATKVDRELLELATQLQVVGRAGVGIDNIDLDAASARNVAVVNAPGGNTVAAAEMTVGLILAAMRNIAAADASVRRGEWNRAKFKGMQLQGRTLGVVGAGRIGREVAGIARGFGMEILAYDPFPTPAMADMDLVEFEDVISGSDVITLHVPLTDDTRNLIDADAIKDMRKDVVIVNASRGGVIDEGALADALAAGTVRAAALDVFDGEPLLADSPLRDAPNLVLTPHLGASTAEAQVAVASEASENMMRVLAEGDISSAINAKEISPS